MKPVLRGWLLLLVFAAGAGAGFGGGYLQLRKVKTALENDLQESGRLNDLLKKKYQEEKARAAHHLRGQARSDALKREQLQEIEKLEQARDAAVAERTAVEEELRSERERTARMASGMKGLEEEMKALEARQRERVAELERSRDAHAAETARLAGEKRILEADARREKERFGQQIRRCLSHNRELSSLASEVLEKYEDKGMATAIAQSEPFTQIKKVRLENLIEDYRDKIDDHRIEDQGGLQ